MLSKTKKYWLILSLFILFLGVRLYHLGYHDFWYDEIRTIEFAKNLWRNDRDAPLYYLLLRFWIKFFGTSEFIVRLPSAILNFLSVVLTFFLGRKLFNLRVGLFAALLMGLSPFHLWYAQEARDYNLAILLGVLSAYLFYKADRKGSYGLWASFALVSIAGLYTHYFYALLILGQAFFILRRKTGLGFRRIAPFLAIIFGFGLYLPRLLKKFSFSQNEIWIAPPTLKSIIISLENFILGYNGSRALYLCADTIAVILFITALKGLSKKELKEPVLMCVFLFFLPLAAAFFFSRQFFPVYVDRRLIIFTPYLYLLLALGITCLGRRIRWALLSLLFFIFCIAGYNYFHDRLFMPFEHHLGAFIKKPFKPAVKFLEDNARSEDALAFTDISAMPSIKFYGRGQLKNPYFFFDPRIPADIAWHRPRWKSIPLEKTKSLRVRKIWVVYANWARNDKWDANTRSVKKWLERRYKQELTKEFDGLYIVRYLKKWGP
ncbi:MAG: glycosyltransferase family 39 protein [Candidatus Omnitrophota bacterium]|jgi:4-amino-4-deoxy-L-arabinose transferase-like glycosyltransferase